jgi:hypothetical protein|tara:strand:+ start:91 stop:300 length:210 start_codon:yes stop_codon:yes gene_type:complete
MQVRLLILFIILSNYIYPCAVCYGDPNSPMSHGMNMGILTLLFVVVGILLTIVAFIISLYFKSKKLNKV